MNILEEANSIVHGARNQAYGHPLDNHGLTARYWTVYLQAKAKDDDFLGDFLEFTAEDVCFLNILQKIARAQNGVDLNRDSLVDIAGYSANVEMILEERKKRASSEDRHELRV